MGEAVRAGDPTPVVRAGLGVALWMRAAFTWESDSFHAPDVIRDMVRAKQMLEPLTGEEPSVVGGLMFRLHFDLSELYWENAQAALAIAELEQIVARPHSPGDMAAVRRAAALDRMATYQKAEVPESTAKMMEEQIRN